MKSTLFVFFFTLMLAACTDEPTINQPNDTEKIIVTFCDEMSAQGNERAHIYELLMIDSTEVTLQFIGNVYTGSIQDTFTMRDTISIERWKILRSLIDFQQMQKVDSLIQPFNSARTPKGWLSVHAGNRSKTIYFHYWNHVTNSATILPHPFDDIFEIVGDARAKFPIN